MTTSTCSNAAMASFCKFTFCLLCGGLHSACFVEVHVEPWFKYCATAAGTKNKQVHHTEATKASIQKPTQACFKKPAKASTKKAIKCLHKRATKCLYFAISSLQKGSSQCLQEKAMLPQPIKACWHKKSEQRKAFRLAALAFNKNIIMIGVDCFQLGGLQN